MAQWPAVSTALLVMITPPQKLLQPLLTFLVSRPWYGTWFILTASPLTIRELLKSCSINGEAVINTAKP